MNKVKRRFRQFISLFLGIARYPFCRSKYCIKRGYVHRKKYDHFSDIGARDEGQDEVYRLAENVAKRYNCKSILDVGCGSAFKLLKYFDPQYDFTGIEILGTYKHLVLNYPNHKWLNGEDVDYKALKADVVICSDVIEHVVEPDDLLNKLKQIKEEQFYVISTPDRLIVRNWFDFGPPKNWTHMREWSGKEFAKYVATFFDVISHQVTSYAEGTQVVVCRPKAQIT